MIFRVFFGFVIWGVPEYSGVSWGCYGGVPGVFRGVPGCYGLVPGFTDTLEVASQRGFKVHQVTVGRAMWSK